MTEALLEVNYSLTSHTASRMPKLKTVIILPGEGPLINDQLHARIATDTLKIFWHFIKWNEIIQQLVVILSQISIFFLILWSFRELKTNDPH